MRILVASTGSHGDVFPFLGLCRGLSQRGHEVILFTSGKFEPLARNLGVSFVAIGTAAEYDGWVRHADLMHPTRGIRVIARIMESFTRSAFEAMERWVVPGATGVVASTLALPARLVHEVHRLPCVVVHLAPCVFRSVDELPRLTRRNFQNAVPRFARPLLLAAMDRWLIDPLFAAPLNRYREELGLPAVTRIFHEWLHRADRVIGLFPAWFAEPAADWPANVALTSFPLFDHDGTHSLAPEVRRWLDAGEHPIVFTAGTAGANALHLGEETIEVCERLRCRGLLLTRYRSTLPDPLPEYVRHFEHIPFTHLLPHTRAIVHHGGIGTSSQALRAGIPQVIRPMAHDQFDNARRIARLGVGVDVSAPGMQAKRVSAALRRMLDSARVRESCLGLAKRLRASNGLEPACELIADALRRPSRSCLE